MARDYWGAGAPSEKSELVFIEVVGLGYSAATCAPLAATERFVSRTRKASTAPSAAKPLPGARAQVRTSWHRSRKGLQQGRQRGGVRVKHAKRTENNDFHEFRPIRTLYENVIAISWRLGLSLQLETADGELSVRIQDADHQHPHRNKERQGKRNITGRSFLQLLEHLAQARSFGFPENDLFVLRASGRWLSGSVALLRSPGCSDAHRGPKGRCVRSARRSCVSSSTAPLRHWNSVNRRARDRR